MLHAFGSFAMGISNDQSDLDLCVQLMPREGKSDHTAKNMKRLAYFQEQVHSHDQVSPCWNTLGKTSPIPLAQQLGYVPHVHDGIVRGRC